MGVAEEAEGVWNCRRRSRWPAAQKSEPTARREALPQGVAGECAQSAEERGQVGTSAGKGEPIAGACRTGKLVRMAAAKYRER